jgi:hypothetical protein
MIEPRDLARSDDALQAALVKALEENAMLRRALEERTLAPGTRRWVGRVIAGLIVALGIAVGAFFLVYTRARSHRDVVSHARAERVEAVRMR